MAAGGMQVGPLAVSGAGADRVPATVQVHVWGRRVWQKRARSLLDGEQNEEKEAQPKAERLGRAARGVTEGYRSLGRWFDPFDMVVFLVGERRRIRARQLEVDLEYSFEDILLTGRLLAAIWLLRSVQWLS